MRSTCKQAGTWERGGRREDGRELAPGEASCTASLLHFRGRGSEMISMQTLKHSLKNMRADSLNKTTQYCFQEKRRSFILRHLTPFDAEVDDVLET